MNKVKRLIAKCNELGLCSICYKSIDKQTDPATGKVFWENGHNAHPINNGRCCTSCNETRVLPVRFRMAVS